MFVSFGEIMLRLSPPGHERLLQARSFDAAFGGGEANVAVSLAQFGITSRFVTALPPNDLGQAALNALRGWGVDTSHILRNGDRLGIYFLEHGASQRPSTVTYDRKGSSIGEIDPSALDWEQILAGAKWFHFTGITPALSPNAETACRDAVEAAKRLGLTVSCDLNYRRKLWSKERAGRVMSSLMGAVDVLLANEEDCQSVFGIAGEGSDVEAGQIDRRRYEQVAQKLTDRFDFQSVAISLRESYSASRNGWSAMFYGSGSSFFSDPVDIDIVDRVGSGDAFAAGIIYGYLRGMPPQEIVDFAAAAGCLKHSMPGDFNIASLAEVQALVAGGGSGRVQR
ncbi:MAG TPA: sugar kinase [Fimbriimonadaceae bacterium]|nr:sugar kinase [Fimbriimonadaceae bacterium]